MDEFWNVCWLYNFDQENTHNVTWVCEKPFVVFLGLENIYQISSLNRNTSDILNFVFSFFLVIWGVWNFEILLIPGIIDLHEPELGEAVLKSNTIKPDRPNLDSDRALSRPPWVDLGEKWFFNNKFFHGFLHVRIPLARLLLPELHNLEWS